MRSVAMIGLTVMMMLVGSLTVAPSAAATEVARKSVSSGDGWPDTRAGAIARDWVRAFASGEAAMRAFNLKTLSRESLAEKGADERIATYRKNRERFGTLVLASIVKSTPGELTVTLMDADAVQHEFIFAVQVAPPYKLISVSRRERRHEPSGFHH